MDNNKGVVVDMLRHIHNDIEICKKELFILRDQISGIAYALQDSSLGHEISDKQVDDITNPEIDVLTEAGRGYSPIDDKDKEEWENNTEKRYMESED